MAPLDLTPPLAVSLEVLRALPMEFWSVLSAMAPYLLFGFLAAGVLSVLISARAVERHLGGRGPWPVVKASLFGVPLPLCSCGVIPVSASLRRHGASRGATTAFLVSTPQTGVDSILVTLSLLGPVLAIFRPVAALATGIVGGALVTLFGGGPNEADAGEPCEEACCSDQAKGGKLRRALAYGFVALPRDIGKPLLVGLVVAGMISALVPGDWFAGRLGRGVVPMLVMMALGIPVYVCATASVPIAAALIAKGVSPGAVLVFLMTGPATNAAALATIWKVLGKRTTLIYLATVGLGALGCGLLLDLLVASVGTASAAHMHQLLPAGIRTASAVVLLTVLLAAIFRRERRAVTAPAPAEQEQTATLQVGGMTCTHCQQAVWRALVESPGVASAEVELSTGRAVVRGKGFDVAALRRAVEGLGYSASGPQ